MTDRAMDRQTDGGGLTWSKGEWDIDMDRAMVIQKAVGG